MKICIFDTLNLKEFTKLPDNIAAKHGIIIQDHNQSFVPRKGDVMIWHDDRKLVVDNIMLDYGGNTIYVFGQII
jgi:hypothetical protein